MSTVTDRKQLAAYRAEIREAWSKVVGRKTLSSAEYDLTGEWFAARVPLDFILQAIRQVSGRAAKTGTTVYSLGVILADLEAVKRKGIVSQVGADGNGPDGWRSQWAEDLESLAGEETNPELAAQFRELIRQLPQLSKRQAQERFQEIKR